MSVEIGSGGTDVDAGVGFLEALIRHQRQPGPVVKLPERSGTAGHHGGPELGYREGETLVEVAAVGDVSVDAFLERQAGPWLVVARPVAGAVGPLAPVFLDVTLGGGQLGSGV